MTSVAGDTSVGAQGDTMNLTLTAVFSVPGIGWVMRSRQF
jgi:hypothetical protein